MAVYIRTGHHTGLSVPWAVAIVLVPFWLFALVTWFVLRIVITLAVVLSVGVVAFLDWLLRRWRFGVRG